MANVNIGSSKISKLRLLESSVPATPASGYGYIYAGTDGNLYFKNDAGDVFGLSTPIPYIMVRDEKPAGTDGGTFTAGSWQTMVINTEVFDTGNNCSLPGSNLIRLERGEYRFRISSPAYQVNSHILMLYDVTSASEIIRGQTAYSNALNEGYTNAEVSGTFTIVSQTDFEVRHRCTSTKSSFGLGAAINLDSENEIYTIAEFWKVA